jgi:hypothetical protein
LEDIGAEVGAEVTFALMVSTPRMRRMNKTSLLFIRDQSVGHLYVAGLLRVLNYESRNKTYGSMAYFKIFGFDSRTLLRREKNMST